MATMRDLQNAIRNLLTSGVMPPRFILKRNALDAAYEAYIFSLVLRAVREIGGNVQLRSIGNRYRQPGTFVFRGSPGYLYSNSDDFGYAVCSYNGTDFEVHVDVQYFGTSKVLHEIDVSILDKAEADRCRQRLTHPNAIKTRAAFECKFYGATLGTALIRTFVGLIDDMGDLKISRFVSNNSSRTVSLYCTGKRSRPRFTDNLSPLNNDAETQFINSVKDDLRKWLG